jgi:predicted acyl esterase
MPAPSRFRSSILAIAVAAVSMLLSTVLAPPVRLEAQAQPSAAAQYFATQVDHEDMVWIPMRDGKRLNASLFFPKGRPRQNLPTILVFFPYTINPAAWPENQRFVENGYALAYVNVRGRYFSEGVYTYLGGSGADSYDVIDWIS